MYYDSEARVKRAGDGGLPFNPFKALIAPRPIGWVTTLAEDGTVNLAPYSYFQAVADQPDVVMFSAALDIADGKFIDVAKDSERNAQNAGEFVCNLVSLPLAEAMNTTSITLPATRSEAEYAGLELAPSKRVAPPRVVGAPAALECVVVDVRRVRHRGGEHKYAMVFGEVVGIHIEDEFITDGLVRTPDMQLVTRLGYNDYAVLESSFSMTRPSEDPAAPRHA